MDTNELKSTIDGINRMIAVLDSAGKGILVISTQGDNRVYTVESFHKLPENPTWPMELAHHVDVIEVETGKSEIIDAFHLRVLSPLEQLASQAEPAPPSDCEGLSEPL